MMKVTVIGANGYMGNPIFELLRNTRGHWAISNPAYDWHTYTGVKWIQLALLNTDLVINCAAAIPDGGVSLLNENKTVCLESNAIFPARLAVLCADRNIPLIHLSTGCFYDESKEWEEHETPVRDWRDYCGTYLGSKWLAERAVAQWEKHYILRLRLPFDEYDHPRNYLSKLCGFSQIYKHANSLTHRGDFAKTVLQFIEKRPTWGTYHCVNEECSVSDFLADRLRKEGVMKHDPVCVDSHTFGSVLSTKKLRDAGIQMRHVKDALDEAIRLWTPRTKAK